MLRREIYGDVDQPTSRVNIEQFAFWSVGKLKADQFWKMCKTQKKKNISFHYIVAFHFITLWQFPPLFFWTFPSM